MTTKPLPMVTVFRLKHAMFDIDKNKDRKCVQGEVMKSPSDSQHLEPLLRLGVFSEMMMWYARVSRDFLCSVLSFAVTATLMVLHTGYRKLSRATLRDLRPRCVSISQLVLARLIFVVDRANGADVPELRVDSSVLLNGTVINDIHCVNDMTGKVVSDIHCDQRYSLVTWRLGLSHTHNYDCYLGFSICGEERLRLRLACVLAQVHTQFFFTEVSS